MKKSKIILLFFFLASISLSSQTLEMHSHNFGLELNGGINIGDFQDFYSSNFGVDAFYFYALSEKVFIGGSVGFANYFGKEIELIGGTTSNQDEAEFIPITASFGVSPLANFLLSGNIGYAIGIGEINDGGFYASPRATYMVSTKFSIYTAYRSISFEEGNLGSLQFGIGYRF